MLLKKIILIIQQSLCFKIQMWFPIEKYFVAIMSFSERPADCN